MTQLHISSLLSEDSSETRLGNVGLMSHLSHARGPDIGDGAAGHSGEHGAHRVPEQWQRELFGELGIIKISSVLEQQVRVVPLLKGEAVILDDFQAVVSPFPIEKHVSCKELDKEETEI